MDRGKQIYTTNLSGFRPIIWLGEALYRRENQLRSILKEKLGEAYAELFAYTNIHSSGPGSLSNGYWFSNYIIDPKPINSYPQLQQEKIKSKLSNMLKHLIALSQELKESERDEFKQIGEIILLAIKLPSENFILTDGDKIVFVLWGFLNDAAQEKNIDLNKFYYEPVKQDTIPPKPKDVPEKSDIIDLQNDSVQEPEQTSKEDEKTITSPPDATTFVPPPPKPPNDKKSKKRKWWHYLLLGLGILLLLLLLFFLLRSCNKETPLPPPGVINPIDTTKIIPQPGDTLQRPIVGNRLNVILDKNADINNFNKELHAQFKNDIKVIYQDANTKMLTVEFYTKDVTEWKKILKGLSGVRIVFEESIFKSGYIPTDPAFKNDMYAYYFKAIKAYGAWDKTFGDPTIKIAIIDDGFDLDHPEFKGKISTPWNVPANSPNVTTYNGRLMHGTHVASLALGNKNNNSGASGIAPSCTFIPIQIADANEKMTSSYIINGFLYAINKGANVINLSLGMNIPPFVSMLSEREQQYFASTLYLEEAAFWEELFQYAAENNIVVVQAAGNSNVLTAIDPMKRSHRSIVVGATDINNAKSPFSNYGNKTNVSAPGSKIFSAMPGSKFQVLDGTSMSSPIVAGAAALILSTNRSLTPADVKKILIETGIPVASSKTLGPLIQLDKALNVTDSYESPIADCNDIVDSLLQVIDELRRGIIDTTEKLIIPDNPIDCNFAKGKWISSSHLVNEKSNDIVKLYFDFYDNCKGKITFNEEKNKKKFYADLEVQIDKKTMLIIMLQEAIDKDGGGYIRYRFECVPDADGVAQCVAKPLSGTHAVVKFTLSRMR